MRRMLGLLVAGGAAMLMAPDNAEAQCGYGGYGGFSSYSYRSPGYSVGFSSFSPRSSFSIGFGSSYPGYYSNSYYSNSFIRAPRRGHYHPPSIQVNPGFYHWHRGRRW